MKAIKKKISRFQKKLAIYAAYSQKISFKKSPSKRIIICYDGLFPHGGFVDRLKGIVSFYEVSKQLGYEFFIQFDHPFELSVFLEPNKVQWQIDRENLQWNPAKTKFLYLMNDLGANPLELIQKSNADTFFVYANLDYLPKMYEGEAPSLIEEKWRASFHELFIQSNYLKEALAVIDTERYVSIHTRFTSLMGDFKDTTKKELSEEQKENLLEKLNQKVNEIASQFENDCFVFSDSVIFLNFISKNQGIRIADGTPKHMDTFNKDATLENHLKTILDFFLIAKSEKVYFLKIEPMYHSSFSKYAAIVGDTPFKTILN